MSQRKYLTNGCTVKLNICVDAFISAVADVEIGVDAGSRHVV